MNLYYVARLWQWRTACAIKTDKPRHPAAEITDLKLKRIITVLISTVGAMFARFSFAVICLISVSHSAPLECDKLVQPLDQLDPHHLEGRWAFVAGSVNQTTIMEALGKRDSITVFLSNSSGPSNFHYTQINRFEDQCQYLHYNITVKGSGFTFDVENRFNFTGSFLSTSCPDCFVMRWNVQSNRRQSSDLYLLSRRSDVEKIFMDEFKDQLTCLGLPSPVIFDPTKELCPEQPEGKSTAISETQQILEQQKAGGSVRG